MQLRKLTHLSKIDFGHHAGKTVRQILLESSGKSYMQWLYFNASHINLCDDLIHELDIEHQLVKPGKDPITFEMFYRPGHPYVSKSKMSSSRIKPGLSKEYQMRYNKERLQGFNQNKYRA